MKGLAPRGPSEQLCFCTGCHLMTQDMGNVSAPAHPDRGCAACWLHLHTLCDCTDAAGKSLGAVCVREQEWAFWVEEGNEVVRSLSLQRKISSRCWHILGPACLPLVLSPFIIMISIISTTWVLEKWNYQKSKAKYSRRMSLCCKQEGSLAWRRERLFPEDAAVPMTTTGTFHHWLSPGEHLPQQTGKARGWVPSSRNPPSCWAPLMQLHLPGTVWFYGTELQIKPKDHWVQSMQKQN